MSPRLRGACAVPQALQSLATRALSLATAVHMSAHARACLCLFSCFAYALFARAYVDASACLSEHRGARPCSVVCGLVSKITCTWKHAPIGNEHRMRWEPFAPAQHASASHLHCRSVARAFVCRQTPTGTNRCRATRSAGFRRARLSAPSRHARPCEGTSLVKPRHLRQGRGGSGLPKRCRLLATFPLVAPAAHRPCHPCLESSAACRALLGARIRNCWQATRRRRPSKHTSLQPQCPHAYDESILIMFSYVSQLGAARLSSIADVSFESHTPLVVTTCSHVVGLPFVDMSCATSAYRHRFESAWPEYPVIHSHKIQTVALHFDEKQSRGKQICEAGGHFSQRPARAHTLTARHPDMHAGCFEGPLALVLARCMQCPHALLRLAPCLRLPQQKKSDNSAQFYKKYPSAANPTH